MKIERFGRMTIPAVVASFGLATASPAAAQRDYRTVPAETVVRAELDDTLSTRTARPGQRFAARLAENDRSGFPEGTRFQGVVTESHRPTKDRPGILNVRVQRAYLPDGTMVPVDGRLASLDEDDVRRSGGRIESRKRGKFDTKWVGYGAAGGAVLGEVLGDNLLKGALLGALGGAAYAYLNKDKSDKGGRYSDVELSRGTDFGILLNNRCSFRDNGSYRYVRVDERYDEYRTRDRYDRDYDSRYDRTYEKERTYEKDRYYDRDTTYRDRDRYDDRYDRDYEYRERTEGYRGERRPARLK